MERRVEKDNAIDANSCFGANSSVWDIWGDEKVGLGVKCTDCSFEQDSDLVTGYFCVLVKNSF